MVREFEHIAENYGIPSEILEKIESDISINGSVSLTALQKEAINNDKFWCSKDDNVNVIVQGATSSGKTLVAELLALQCVFSMNKHVVYLVPLKALVSEKVRQFREDIDIYNKERKMNINIFASSSDHQDHDTELAEGQYNIAVVVYEKFFAMLAEQKDNKFLEKCGLIIVDEIQLLGSQDRGAKLEYSLTKVRNNYENSIRILGLTTVDCDTNYVNRWLDAEIIQNSQRPIGLKERIISLSGLYWERYISGESVSQNMMMDVDPTEGQIKIEDAEKLKNQKLDVKRNALLCSLLKKLNMEDSEKKIIIFANSRNRCKRVAKTVAKGNVYGNQAVDPQLISELEKTDDESEKNLLQNELLPYGIAYHSAALPTSLRELIEKEFRKNDGCIKLIVATETITIGMNLPADVMILYDNKVNRGSDGSIDIRPQEYKNYIGRAGRLGLTNKIGESYLFVDSDMDIRFSWNEYVDCKIEEVSSALNHANARECAPYYLNLLCKGKEEKFSKSTIEKLAKKTLNAAEISCNGAGEYTVEADKIFADFQKVELIQDIKGDGLDDVNGYKKLTIFGEMLAPYALSMQTCYDIKQYFRDGRNKDRNYGGLPIEYTSEDLKEEKYLLDILYRVCRMDEVKKISHPRLPAPEPLRNRMLYSTLEKAILDYLTEYKEHKEKEGVDAFWDDSEIERVFFGDEEIDTDRLNAALRAILLFHWIKGELPSEMREHAGLNNKEFSLNTGDMARIGESCSYVVEAISKCLFTNVKRNDHGKLEQAFYSLSVKLKYGLSNTNLRQIASRHVHGLSRSTIIKMDRVAQDLGFDTIYLFIRSSNKKVLEYLNDQQRKVLIQQIDEGFEDRNVENLIAKLVKGGNIEISLESDFETIAYPKEVKEWLGSIRMVFSYLSVIPFPLQINDVKFDGIKLQWENYKELYILLLFGESLISKEDSIKYREQLKLQPDDKIMFIHNRDIEHTLENPNDILIRADYMTKVILEFLALSGCNNGIIICDYFYEQERVVSDKGMKSLQASIERTLDDFSKKIDQDRNCEDEDIDPYEEFIRKQGYEYIERKRTPDGHATIHVVEAPHGMGKCAVKEIKIPEDENYFDRLDADARKLYDRYGEIIGEEEIRNIIREDLRGSEITDNDLNTIIEMSQNREKQLVAEVEDKKRYYYQSIAFLTEAYKKFNEACVVRGLSGNHIANIEIADIIHRDYETPSLNRIDSKFNKLQSSLFFVMELYDGSLSDRFKKLQENRTEIINIGVQISEALVECHEKGILHRDIKPGNILFKGDESREELRYYLCDFGCATKFNQGKTKDVGTLDFMPPEAHSGKYSERSDIYSLGKTLLYLYHGNNRWNDVGQPEGKDDDLLKVLRKACEEAPLDRYERVCQFKEELENLK